MTTEQRKCEKCGQPVPPKSKLATTEGGRFLCLACQIRAAQDRGLKH